MVHASCERYLDTLIKIVRGLKATAVYSERYSVGRARRNASLTASEEKKNVFASLFL
jgi:hypothetical protein